MTEKEERNNKQLVVLAAAVLVPVLATARLLNIWLSQPWVTSIAIFVWLSAAYWVPPRPKMSPWTWLIIVSLISVTTFLLILLGFDPFWRK